MENELSSHERKGFLVDVPDPLYEPTGKHDFVARGVAAMNSGILIFYRRDFRIRKTLLRKTVITSEKRSYSAVLQGEGTIVRFDSGQVTHSPDPHMHTQLSDFTDDIRPPTFPLASPVELGHFIERIEEWRFDHLDYLPESPGSVANARIP
jgi:hypothetical protein